MDEAERTLDSKDNIGTDFAGIDERALPQRSSRGLRHGYRYSNANPKPENSVASPAGSGNAAFWALPGGCKVRIALENNGMPIDKQGNVLLQSDHPVSPPSANGPGWQARSSEQLVPRMIAAQAKLNPDRIALVMGSEKLTYAELEFRATQLANYLRSLGAGPEVLVGLCVERSPQFVIAALAIMQCGAAYLPMDLAHPAERLRFILKDAAVRLLVTQRNFADRFVDLDTKIIALDAEKNAIGQQPIQSPNVKQGIDSLAYVIYTSGSSGRPKGVEITHRNLSNLVSWHVGAFDLDCSARGTFQAGVGFDAAVWEIWPSLTVGSAVYLPDDFTRMSAESLRDWLVVHQITITFVPTAMAEQLIALPWPAGSALRFLLTGADTLHRYPPAGLPFSFVNNYGPTECTVVATSGVIAVDRSRDGLPSIGFPIDNVRIHILDEQLREVPKGVPGEIYIGGNGVARGYRNRPDLTAERFIADPFRSEAGRLYRTGDLGRTLANGEIAFLGRMDDQIKVRGYRIELNEINAVLNEHPSVQASVVIAREEVPGDKRLIAYIVPVAKSTRDEQSLRELIRRRLPDYMEPAAFVWMESLPLTPNGKVDRAALPLPGIESCLLAREFIGPRTPVEEALAGIIREVLKVRRVSVDDDFFHLGAHSLLGAQIVARVRGVFGTELKLLDVFDAPTVAELSTKIEQALTLQLNAMTEAEVDAALAALNGAAAKGTDSQ
jgi:amino acid adenylation domain-containing protein